MVFVSFLRRLTLKHYVLIALGVMALVALALVYRHLDIEAIHRRTEEVSGLAVFAGIVVAPLVGLPVSVVHAIAGLRFGIGPGCLVVALATLLQLLAAYGLVKLAPGFFERKLGALRERLPEGTHTPVTLFTMLLPGVPYFAQIYVLPMVGVPLGTFMLWSLPINVARSVVGVTFGGIFDHLTPWRLAGFGLYTVTISLVCAWSFRRLRQKMQAAPRLV